MSAKLNVVIVLAAQMQLRYAHAMNQLAEETPVFNYVVSIEDREFIVTVTQNRMSQWDDLTGRSLVSQLRDEVAAESVIAVQASEKICLKALEMAQKEKMEEARTGKFREPAEETANDIAEMDRLLEEFFWRKVNPLLEQPLTNPRQ
jgi:hypothetical protein